MQTIRESVFYAKPGESSSAYFFPPVKNRPFERNGFLFI